MPRPRLPPSLVRPIAALLLAIGCAACGNAAANPSTPAASVRTSPTTTTSTTTTTTTSSSSSTTATVTGSSSATSPLPGAGKPPIVVGDKNYTEQFVLGQLYAQALQAQGFTVSVNPNIGPTSVTVQALRSGSLTMYPEYLNVFYTSVAGYKHGFGTQLSAYQAAQHWALAHDLELLAPTPFGDTQAIAVTDAYAADNHLRSIADLSGISTGLTIGGPSQFQRGTPGLPLLEAAYGVTPAAFRPLALGDQYSALNSGVVQAADVYRTDGQLASGDYVILSDPQRIFGWGNVVPVVSARAILAEGPDFADTIERVDSKLTTATMRELNELVDVAHQTPAAVARQFLQTHGLLTPPAG